MRLVAPVGILASAEADGLLFPAAWPPCRSREDSKLTVTVGGERSEGADVLPIPGVAVVVAESIEGWWGAHRWSYPQSSVSLLVGGEAFGVDGWPVARVAALIDRGCSELRATNWSWVTSSNGVGIRWCAGETVIELIVGRAVRITYPARLGVGEWSSVTRDRQEVVLLLEGERDPDDVLVWLGFPTDLGLTLNERLSCLAPLKSLPRCLRIPRDRLTT